MRIDDDEDGGGGGGEKSYGVRRQPASQRARTPPISTPPMHHNPVSIMCKVFCSDSRAGDDGTN